MWIVISTIKDVKALAYLGLVLELCSNVSLERYIFVYRYLVRLIL